MQFQLMKCTSDLTTILLRYYKGFMSDGTSINQLALAGKGDAVLFAATEGGSLKTYNCLKFAPMSGLTVEERVDESNIWIADSPKHEETVDKKKGQAAVLSFS